jgi:zinc protease
VRTVEGITEYRLDNGLSVLLFPDPGSSTVTINITYGVGSRLEGYGETGMAHLLEHLMFKGTPRHRNVLKLLGTRGAEANGSTWTDRTNYYETLPASPENLDWALDLEADRMVHASIAKEDLDTEFSVVRNEFEIQENNADRVLDQRTVATAYLWHNYGKATIGSRADIERVPIAALRAFYEKYYQPDNAVLVVSGKFDESAALASTLRYFAPLPKPARVLAPSYTVEPVQDGERTVTVRRAGDVYAFQASYHTVGAASPDYPAVKAAIDILTREPSGRLYRSLVETKLVTSLRGDQTPFRDPYVASFDAHVPKGSDLAHAVETATRQIEAFGTTPIDPREVERWRSSELKRLEVLMMDSAQAAIQLSESVALGDWRMFFAYRERVKRVTADDVARVARAYFKPDNRTLGTFVPTRAPDRAPLTESPDYAVAVKDIDGGEGIRQGEPFAATLENIEARTVRRALHGGLRAAFLPKKTRGGKVSGTIHLHWGNERALQNTDSVGAMTADLLVRGTTHLSYQDIRDKIDALRMRISVQGAADGLVLSFDTRKEHLTAALALIADMLTSPSFSAHELDVVRAARLNRYEEALEDPIQLGFAAAAQRMQRWPLGDPRRSTTPAEAIAETRRVTLADVRSFYDSFVGADHGEVSIVGDFDVEAVSSQIEASLGAWKSKAPYARLVERTFGVPGSSARLDTPDKQNALIVMREELPMKNDDPDYPSFLIMTRILGGGFGSRLWMRLREREGLSYTVGSMTRVSAFDPSGTLYAFALVAPSNAAKAKASILDEIRLVASGHVDDAEVARAKEEWTKEEETSLSDDENVAAKLADQAHEGRTNAWSIALRRHVQELTPADIARAAATYLRTNALTIVEAGDAKKMEALAPK